MNRNRRLSLALALALTLAACASAPASLSPAGVSAFNNTRVIKGLDLIRDTAVDAHAQIPPLLSTDTTRKVVTFHASAITIVHATGHGWAPIVLAGLDALVKDVPPGEKQLLAPYVALAKTIIAEVIR
jgi:hypothetical protein